MLDTYNDNNLLKGGSMYKILIVDDDYAIRLLYQSELEDEGYSVMTTSGCLNLLKQIDHLRPDLILLETRLDKINGLDILQDIRDRYYDMPVILCSASPSFRYDMRAIAADYYVTKSIDLSELKFKIKMAFESIMEGAESFNTRLPGQYSFEPYECKAGQVS
jgi:DNA-binding response OmpR family regulator